MANVESTTRTNLFHVTDEERYQELFGGIIGEDVYDLSKALPDGTLIHGFGAYNGVDYQENEEAEYDFDTFLKELQKILPDNEVFVYITAGNEKLRSVFGAACVVTNREIRWMNLEQWASDAARNMLGAEPNNSAEF